jgi:hypothetical protein
MAVMAMKQHKRAPIAKHASHSEAGALEARAVRAFGEATRKAAGKAFAAGLALPGRVRGRRVRVAADGAVSKLPADDS